LKKKELIKNNDQWLSKLTIITSIPGVGKTTAHALLAEMPEIGKISDKQIAALLGVAPFIRPSGTYRGTASIGGGRSEVRHIIYMAAIASIRFNSVLKAFYERLRGKGKSAKVCIVAVMRKIIVIVNNMVKKNQVWREA
jgi:transposase